LQAYSTTVNGGSMYYDGTTDFLTLPSNQLPFSAGTGDFTFECWVYITSIAAVRTMYDTCNAGDSAGTGRFGVQISTSGVIQVYTGAGSVITSGGTVRINTWNHIAFSRNSASSRIYLNGTQVNTTYADTNNYVVGTVSRPIIGINAFDNSSNPFLGNIFDLRLVKGTGLYAASFVPSATPLTAVTNTSLLLLGTNYASPDNAIQNNFETAGNAQISTSVYKFSTGSWAFDGTGDFLKQGLSYINTSFDAGDFTIEFWVYPAATPAATRDLIAKGHQSSGSTFGSYLVTINTSNVVSFYASSTGASYNIINNQTIGTAPNTTWTAIAITRSGSSWRAYINGSLASGWPITSTATLFNASQVNLVIGADSIAGANFNGNLDEIRLTKGIARYTGSTYTLQTAAFPNQ